MQQETLDSYQRTADKPWQDEKVLRKLYHKQELTTHGVAEKLGCAQSTIRKWMGRYDIPTRTHAESLSLRVPEPVRDPDTLRKLYNGEGLTAPEIAERVDCPRSTVYKYLDDHGIERKRDISGSKNPSYNSKTVECSECGCTFSRPVSQLEGNDRHFCDRGCFDEWIADRMAGQDSPRYDSGRDRVYGPGWDDTKREVVRERDNRLCQDCRNVSEDEHLNQYGERLHVHHICDARESTNPAVYNSKRNLITLCRPCHGRREGKKKALSRIFGD